MVCILAKGSGDCASPAYHDHPPRRLLLNFPDTIALGYVLWGSDLERLVPFRFAVVGQAICAASTSSPGIHVSAFVCP